MEMCLLRARRRPGGGPSEGSQSLKVNDHKEDFVSLTPSLTAASAETRAVARHQEASPRRWEKAVPRLPRVLGSARRPGELCSYLPAPRGWSQGQPDQQMPGRFLPWGGESPAGDRPGPPGSSSGRLREIRQLMDGPQEPSHLCRCSSVVRGSRLRLTAPPSQQDRPCGSNPSLSLLIFCS